MAIGTLLSEFLAQLEATEECLPFVIAHVGFEARCRQVGMVLVAFICLPYGARHVVEG
jgi:hypothetical protein